MRSSCAWNVHIFARTRHHSLMLAGEPAAGVGGARGRRCARAALSGCGLPALAGRALGTVCHSMHRCLAAGSLFILFAVIVTVTNVSLHHHHSFVSSTPPVTTQSCRTNTAIRTTKCCCCWLQRRRVTAQHLRNCDGGILKMITENDRHDNELLLFATAEMTKCCRRPSRRRRQA